MSIKLLVKQTSKKSTTKETYFDWKISCSFLVHGEEQDFPPFLKLVEFQLHDSFPNSKRKFSKSPISIAESGWGGFEIPILLTFQTKVDQKDKSFVFDLVLERSTYESIFDIEFRSPNETLLKMIEPPSRKRKASDPDYFEDRNGDLISIEKLGKRMANLDKKTNSLIAGVVASSGHSSKEDPFYEIKPGE